MKITFYLILTLFVTSFSLKAQKHPKGRTMNISSETVEIQTPTKNKPVETKNQSEEIKQVQNSIKTDLKEYTLEMQKQRFISDNVITEVNAGTSNINGKETLKVTYSYTLKNDTMKFRTDDFGPGKYLVNESNALQVTLAEMKKSIEGKLAKYITSNKEISITINGSADAVPIKNIIQYKEEFGQKVIEICDLDGKVLKMEVAKSSGIHNNQTLAFLRSYAVRDYLKNNIFLEKYSNLKYHHSASVSGQRGGQFRRVFIEMIVYNAFE